MNSGAEKLLRRTPIPIVETGSQQQKETATQALHRYIRGAANKAGQNSSSGASERKLALGDKEISDAFVPALVEAVRRVPVETLDLRDNQLSCVGCEELARCLELDEHVQHVILCSNRIGAEGAAYLGNAVRYNRSVREWDLSGNFIGDSGVAGFCSGLLLNRTIMTIILRRTAIDDEGCEALHLALKGNTALTELDLSCNMFGEGGLRSLAKALLEDSCSLRFLDLRENKLGDPGAALLARGLGPACTLQTLFLCKCSINDAGVIALMGAVRESPCLETLDLSGNVFGDAGAEAVSSSLAVHPTLAVLDVRGNRFGELGRDCVIMAIRALDRHQDRETTQRKTVTVYVAPGMKVKWAGMGQGVTVGGDDANVQVVDAEDAEAVVLNNRRMCSAVPQLARSCGPAPKKGQGNCAQQ